MTTEDWTEAEAAAIEARKQADSLVAEIQEPEDSIDQAAFWARLEVIADNRKWKALVASKEEGQKWWRLGIAVGKSAEPLRQQYYRKIESE